MGWMIVFDLFIDTVCFSLLPLGFLSDICPVQSVKVRIGYIEQLRLLDIIPKYFMPNLLGLLGLDRGPSSSIKLDHWVVDEYHVLRKDIV